MASPKIQTPAEIIFDNTDGGAASTPSSGETLVGVDQTTKKLYSIDDTGSRTNYGEGGGGGGGSGIMGQDEGINVGTGTVLNVVGQRALLTKSGTVLNLTISPDPVELIGVLGRNQGSILGTGTTIDWGLGMNASISGSVLFIHPFAGGTHDQVWTRDTGTVQGASWQNATGGSSKGYVMFLGNTVPLPSGTQNMGAPLAGLDGASNPAEGILYYHFIGISGSVTTTYREFYCRLINYQGGGMTLRFDVMRTDAAAGDTYIFDAAIRRINAGTENLGSAHSYDYNSTTVTIPAGPPAAGIPMAGTITFSDGADMDSLASGESFILRFRRNGGTAKDTARVLVTLSMEET